MGLSAAFSGMGLGCSPSSFILALPSQFSARSFKKTRNQLCSRQAGRQDEHRTKRRADAAGRRIRQARPALGVRRRVGNCRFHRRAASGGHVADLVPPVSCAGAFLGGFLEVLARETVAQGQQPYAIQEANEKYGELRTLGCRLLIAIGSTTLYSRD